ncbi:16S rRNA (guanine(527)-N(7))-methyltransferase RsmG [Candidatus Pandoraea novymonadis]|uniref:Ribosomal RNA small subunit methyltransferase G n=1 Tax=Candidatus Pandoraea novymonadis TaxID=1808959 RepID=A0ABX5FFI5_9BURK|nr:16S rRNA (guanine(527)-N(7))-methyltransferase RsmG [Candidatus Pandoraea novymonadis]PSB92479.1 Ribosomal RNA small subunit methyltransferase G [Candidatus Pandoraea novymonadis]
MTILSRLLTAGIKQIGVPIDVTQHQKLLDYQILLAKWNGVYNLTAIHDSRQILIQHVLDSLSILPRLMHESIHRILDVGSGGGLPGIILAIACPDWQITVNDIVRKKTAFLIQAKGVLELPNVTVVTGRVEQCKIGEEIPVFFDAIVSRAFSDLSNFIRLTRHLLAPEANIWAMKGLVSDDELAQIPEDSQLLECIPLHVPFLEAKRHLLRIKVDIV